MRTKAIFNYVFLFGLGLLILNDHVLKGAFGNIITGKLSDFAGILILPMFLKYLFPISTRKSILATLLFFIFWKSPFSQGLIDFANSIFHRNFTRVVDYTDFIAFVMLPFSFYVLHHLDKFAITLKTPRIKVWTTQLIFLVTVFSFIATSQEDDFPVDPVFDNSITSCCELNPVDVMVGNGNVFIPTLFTPDGNGINDFFQITADSNILRIDTFIVCYNSCTDTAFFQTNIVDIIPENGFDGVLNDTIWPLQYFYDITVTSKDSVKSKFAGNICCIPCVNPTNLPRPASINSCGLSTQYDEVNGYDPTIDSGENLDCFD